VDFTPFSCECCGSERFHIDAERQTNSHGASRTVINAAKCEVCGQKITRKR